MHPSDVVVCKKSDSDILCRSASGREALEEGEAEKKSRLLLTASDAGRIQQNPCPMPSYVGRESNPCGSSACRTADVDHLQGR